MRMLDALRWLVVATGLSSTVSAAAQTATPLPQAATTPKQLDRIVVTARRREESLRQVPASVTAVAGEELEARGAPDLAALALDSPNVVLIPARAFNGTLTAFIRGIGQTDPIWGLEPSIGVYLDDVYLARPQGALLDLLDVERVEVLRGPQGTLYGRNTLGGAIKLVTRKPEPVLAAEASVTVGGYGRRDGKAMLNLPLSPTLATRLAVGKFGHDGYGRNLATGADASARDALALRWTAAWTPREDVSAVFAFDRRLDQSGPQGFRRMAVNPLDPRATPPDPGRFDVRDGAPPLQDLASQGGSATLDWALGNGRRLRAISAYREGDSQAIVDFDALPQNISQIGRRFRERQASQELQFLGEGTRTQGIAGLYWLGSEAAGTVYQSGIAPGVGSTSGNVRSRALAGYVNLTHALSARWRLELGARYTRERKTATVLNRNHLDARLDPATAVVNSDFVRGKTYADFSPRISVAWQATPAWMLYALGSRGFKAGTFNVRANARQLPASALPLADESATTWEAGGKGAWFDARLALQAAVFHNRYRDIQLSVNVPVDGDGDGRPDRVFVDLRNAGDGRSRGAELEASLRLGRELHARAQAGYLETRYDRYESDGRDVAASKRFPNAPRWTAGGSLVWDHALRRGGWLVARVDGRFQSRVDTTPDLDPRIAQPAYAVWGASLAWTSPQQRWRIALQGDNLGDAAYRTTGFVVPPLGIVTAAYGPPRSWSLTASWRY